jgi:hypothetical protein
MAGFAGFDTSIYPGDSIMEWLKANSNLAWCGYYLAPAPSHGDTSWMGKREHLSDLGWGFAPLYLGEQVHGQGVRGSFNPSPEKGTADGEDAAEMMANEGFDPGSCVYLDLENGPPLQEVQRSYVSNWCDAVQQAGFTPGVYCSHGMAQAVQQLRPDCRIWAFKILLSPAPVPPLSQLPNPDPSGSGFPGAFVYQLDQNRTIKVLPTQIPLKVDLDSALVQDPSAPETTQADAAAVD